MGAPAAASEIIQFFVIHRQKMAYNGLKNINQIPSIVLYCLGIWRKRQIYLIMS
jgi:hypothetical protein